MRWKFNFKSQTTLLLIILAVLFSTGVYANASSEQGVSDAQSSAPVKVTGEVTDEKGESMPGVSIVVKGTTQGILTDVDGKFVLDVKGPEVVLEFSFVGY